MPDLIAPAWTCPERETLFHQWLSAITPQQNLLPETLTVASADASFRRYFRIQCADGQTSRIIMDAPPEHENCQPFVHVAELMQQAGLPAPQILHWHTACGFMLLTDLGQRTMMSALDPANPSAAQPYFTQAIELLLQWQSASRPNVLPPYDSALLQRELQLFPDWYLRQHRQIEPTTAQAQTLASTFEQIVQRNLAAPSVYVHRDFMPRNLMLGDAPNAPLGILDFQDAVYGPITYDIASLLRDAFISWDEDFVIDITVRYWEKARKAGLVGATSASGWGADFGEFYRAVEWMGLQRHLKVAGIFARLTLRDGKPKYLQDAPRFIHYLRSTCSRYRELGPLLRLIDQIENIQPQVGYAYGRV